MKLRSQLALLQALCLCSTPVLADDSMNQYSQQQAAQSTQNIAQYLLNLGGYLGYTLNQSPTGDNKKVSQNLLDLSTMQLIQTYMVNTFLGAIPVNASNSNLALFLPKTIPLASAINPWANNSFNSQTFNNPSSAQEGKVSVKTGVDQQTFQQDPVNQAVLNILGTPDNSYCMNYEGTSWVGCAQAANSGVMLLPSLGVMSNIIGPLPSTYQYYTYQYNQPLLGQLNSNSLTGPLLYSSQSAGSGTSSSPSTAPNNGLSAQNQAQEAANFIRYVSGTVTPLQLPKLKEYDTLYNQANPSPRPSTPTLQQIQAQTTLDTYFTTLRTYAAQISVGMSNLYFIMSKRLPQSQSNSGQDASSQALGEFKMATWRLFNPDMSANNQWLNKINDASSATVQKEIAALLAEMNYQMYLQRQMQERLLMTNSIMLIQNTRLAQPSNNLSNSQDNGSSSNP